MSERPTKRFAARGTGQAGERKPSPWAAFRGGFVLAAGLVGLASWRRREAEQTETEELLRFSEDHFRITFEAAAVGMALVGLDGRFLRVNRALCEIVDYRADALLATTFQAITHPDDLELDLAHLRRCLDGTIDGYEMEKRYFHRDGRVVWVQLNVAVAHDADGKPGHFVAQILDITERRSAAATLAASEARFAAMVEHGSDLIAIADFEGRLVYASPAYRTVLGIDPIERIGRPLQDDIHPDDQAAVFELGAELAVTPGASATSEFRFAHADGSWRWVETTMTNRLDDPAVGGYVINTRDVTERVLANERLAHQASHDSLTGLPNRVLLEERMIDARAAAIRNAEVLSILYVDVDHFKAVNDAYGHGVGDLVLTEVANRLRTVATAQQTIARLGGDEFVIVAGLPDEPAARELAAHICDAFREPFVVEGRTLAVTVSVGVATSDDTEADVDLLEAADLAMYEAKAVGRAGWVTYLPHMRRRDRRDVDTSETDPALTV
jgi:diguanylate cyclase (GGDEF)-like protein/PAS domain S-box-containing protein